MKGTRVRERLRLVAAGNAKRSRSDAGVRWTRVRAARARIATRFYDREDVRARLMDAILEELSEA
jgi:hypothetical protein